MLNCLHKLFGDLQKERLHVLRTTLHKQKAHFMVTRDCRGQVLSPKALLALPHTSEKNIICTMNFTRESGDPVTKT